MPLSPETRLGDYENVAPLGTGGMGEVYRSRDPRLNRNVAIKVLAAEMAREATAVARFSRPHDRMIYYGAEGVEADIWIVERK